MAGVCGGLGVKFFFNGLIAIGILFGILIVLSFEFFTDFFGASIQPSGELMAAILGASIGWAGTVLTIHASIEARNDEQHARDQAVVVEIFVKFQSIVNNLHLFREHIRNSYGAVDLRSHVNPGLFILSLAGHPDPIKFTPEEKALFIRLKKKMAANDIGIWDSVHNSLLRAFEKYAELREVFLASTPAKMEGNVGRSEMTEEEFAHFDPKLAQLNHLVEQIKGRVEDD